MISSLQNDKIKLVRALQGRRRARQREGCFVLEGVRLVEEVVKARVSPLFVLYTGDLEADQRGGKLLESLRAIDGPCYQVSEPVMAACSDTQTPQGVLAVLPVPDLPRPACPALTLVLDQVRDPGNLGTILRTALAAGVEQVLLAPGTVDAHNPKTVRAAMGAHLRLPIATLGWDGIRQAVRGSNVWLAAAGGEIHYASVDWSQPVVLIVGGEAEGAGQQAQALARGRIFIPMGQAVESLNTAVATSVILFEILRQRSA